MSNARDGSLLRHDAKIFILGVLILYLELVLIRWIGTEIRIFAYLGNLILVVCFFGVGLGCYLSERPVLLWRMGLNILLLAVLVANPLHWQRLNLKLMTYLLGGFEDYNIWQVGLQPKLMYVLGGLSALAGLTWLTFYIFVPVGQSLGQSFQEHPRSIRAYSVNIAGSLAGVWIFQAISFASWSSPWWFACAAVMAATLVCVQVRKEWTAVALIGCAAIVVWLGRDPARRTVWSPYQKLALRPHLVTEGTNSVMQGYELTVNDASFQLLLNLSEPFLQSHPALFDLRDARRSYYNLPFAFKPDIRQMLIVGPVPGITPPRRCVTESSTSTASRSIHKSTHWARSSTLSIRTTRRGCAWWSTTLVLSLSKGPTTTMQFGSPCSTRIHLGLHSTTCASITMSTLARVSRKPDASSRKMAS